MDVKVTVVIALFNKRNYIKQCINSVLNQSFVNFEVLVINDGSTDGSEQELLDITDSRFKLINQKNYGPGVARNLGLSLATTKWVAFLDADDTWNSDFLKVAFEDLNQVECDLWICGATWYPDNEVRIPFHKNEVVCDGLFDVLPGRSALDAWNLMNFFATGTVVIKTDIVRKFGGYFDLQYCTSGEDGFLWIQVMFSCKIYRTSKALLKVNIGASDLGIGRKSIKPIPPALTHSEILFKSCPDKFHNDLNSLLHLLAFMAFRRELYQFNFSNSIYLNKKFPKLFDFRDENYPRFPFVYVIIPLKRIFVKPLNTVFFKLKSWI